MGGARVVRIRDPGGIPAAPLASLAGRGSVPRSQGRCRSEAAFAALSGTSPIPASSGRTVRHRLNRGGDRALNRAIYAIALTRMRSCPRPLHSRLMAF